MSSEHKISDGSVTAQDVQINPPTRLMMPTGAGGFCKVSGAPQQ